MNLPMLAVDKDAEVSLREQGEWQKHGIATIRVDTIEKYDPGEIGVQWDKTNSRIQLEPIGTRGYIELLPIK